MRRLIWQWAVSVLASIGTLSVLSYIPDGDPRDFLWWTLFPAIWVGIKAGPSASSGGDTE